MGLIRVGTDLGGRCCYGNRGVRAGWGEPGGPAWWAGISQCKLVLKPSCWDARRGRRQSHAGQVGFAHTAETYVGWVWFYSWIQSLCSLPFLCGQDNFLFFSPLPPLPWPSVSQCLLLASSMRDSGQIGTSPFPSWEGTWLSSCLLGCFGHPFLHFLQHLHSFPELHVVFLDWQLGFRSREDNVSALVSNICGDCVY